MVTQGLLAAILAAPGRKHDRIDDGYWALAHSLAALRPQ